MNLNPQTRHLEMLKGLPSMRRKAGEDIQAWQEAARERLKTLLGLPSEDTEENFAIEWERECEYGCTETRFTFDSEPDTTVLCHLLVPKHESGVRLPVVICLQGHSKGMHISLGRPKYEGDEKTIRGGDRDFARQIVERGQAALVIEQRGFGERGGTENGPACQQPAMQALLLGRTLVGERCRDVSCAIDCIEKHFPELDTQRVAVMGNSGGGTTSIYAAAVDTRIAAAMPSCAFCGYLESIGEIHHCVCNYIPNIANVFDMGDVAALIAPRPLIIVSGKEDNIFPLKSAQAQAEIVRKAYEDMNCAEKFEHVIGSEGHRFYAEIGWKAFDAVTGWKE